MTEQHIYTFGEVLDFYKGKDSTIFYTGFIPIATHMYEEIGEIASLILRSEDIMVPISDNPRHLTEFDASNIAHLSPADKQIFIKYSEFYRWCFDAKAFHERLESEIIDMVMMCALFVHRLMNHKPDYNYDLIRNFKFNIKNDIRYYKDNLLHHLGYKITGIMEKCVYDKTDEWQTHHLIEYIFNILGYVCHFCNYYQIDVNFGIMHKFEDLRKQGR